MFIFLFCVGWRFGRRFFCFFFLLLLELFSFEETETYEVFLCPSNLATQYIFY